MAVIRSSRLVFMKEGCLPFTVLNGRPGYINLLDAFSSWQLVKSKECDQSSCCSFLQTYQSCRSSRRSPLIWYTKKSIFVEGIELTPLALLIFVPVVQIVCLLMVILRLYLMNVMLQRHLSWQEKSLTVLIASLFRWNPQYIKGKAQNYLVIQMDPNYTTPLSEIKVFGITYGT